MPDSLKESRRHDSKSKNQENLSLPYTVDVEGTEQLQLDSLISRTL